MRAQKRRLDQAHAAAGISLYLYMITLVEGDWLPMARHIDTERMAFCTQSINSAVSREFTYPWDDVVCLAADDALARLRRSGQILAHDVPYRRRCGTRRLMVVGPMFGAGVGRVLAGSSSIPHWLQITLVEERLNRCGE